LLEKTRIFLLQHDKVGHRRIGVSDGYWPQSRPSRRWFTTRRDSWRHAPPSDIRVTARRESAGLCSIKTMADARNEKIRDIFYRMSQWLRTKC